MVKTKLSKKEIILITSTLFGMLFGAGNLIFPVHLGQLAGSHLVAAAIGFIITGVGIPILGVVAIGASNSSGLFSLCSKASKQFAFFFTTVLYLTIGPLFVMPRSASISYGSGINVILGDNNSWSIYYLAFCIIFFVIVTFFSLRPSGITVWIGKIINPVFLLFLGVLMVVALFNPLGDVFQAAPNNGIVIPGDYQERPFFEGFLEGYKTLDALAGLAFGIIVIDIIKKMGVKDKGAITKNCLKAGLLTGIMIALIYALIIMLGAQSLGKFELSTNGSIALNQISTYYFGTVGDVILALIVTLASIKTSIGLTTSCATAFNKMYPKVSYNKFAITFIMVSLLISNMGLDQIIEFTAPVLKFLCPLCIILIILAFTGKYFNHSKVVYAWTLVFAAIPAFLDLIIGLPSIVTKNVDIQAFIDFSYAVFPFAEIGFSWLVPSIIGLAIGLFVYYGKKRHGKLVGVGNNHEKTKKN